MHWIHSRVFCTSVALVLAAAPGLGCAVIGQIFGIKKQEEPPKTYTVAKPPEPDPPPQPEYTEEQWTEYIAAAEAKVKDAGATKLLPPLRLVGDFPDAEQVVEVKGGHCYDVGLAWSTPERSTSVSVYFLKDDKGQRTSDTQSMTKARVAPPAGAMRFCADHDGKVTLAATILTRNNSILYSKSRTEPVQWAAVLGERKEDKQAAEARREAEAKEVKARKAQGRRNLYRYELEHYGREVADFCERCRRLAEMCMEERKDQGEKKALEYCGMSWQNCAAPMNSRGSSRVCEPP